MFPATPNAIYHATVQLKTDQEAKVDVPDVRVRVQSTVDAVTNLIWMKQGTDAVDNMLPSTAYTDYEVLFTANANTESGDVFGVHFELINFGFGATDAILSFGQVMVTSALIADIRGAGNANLTPVTTFDFNAGAEKAGPHSRSTFWASTRRRS